MASTEAQFAHHVAVRQFGQRGQGLQVVKPHRRKPAGGDGLQVPSRTLDEEHILFPTEDIAQATLDRSVAATVQHQIGGPSEKLRTVDSQSQWRIARELRRLLIIPLTQHAPVSRKRGFRK
jgi:hypothetical protein